MLTSCTELTRYCIEIIFWVKAYHKKIHFSIEAEEKKSLFSIFLQEIFLQLQNASQKERFYSAAAEKNLQTCGIPRHACEND